MRLAGPAIVRLGLGNEDRSPLIAGNRIEAGVRGHAVEPWAQRRAFLQAVAIPPGGAVDPIPYQASRPQAYTLSIDIEPYHQ
jgi:hypothetical protein